MTRFFLSLMATSLFLVSQSANASWTVTEYNALSCVATNGSAPVLPVFKYEANSVYREVIEQKTFLYSKIKLEATTFGTDWAPTIMSAKFDFLPTGSSVSFDGFNYQGLTGKPLSVVYIDPQTSVVLDAAPPDIKVDFVNAPVSGQYIVMFSATGRMTITINKDAVQIYSGPVHCQGQKLVNGVLGDLSPFPHGT
jgi:hypothetical protein